MQLELPQEAKDILDSAKSYGIADLLSEFFTNKENLSYASQDWAGFSDVINEVGASGGRTTAEPLFIWFSDPQNTEKAACCWKGFAEVVGKAIQHKIISSVFVYLRVKKNRDNAAANWTKFAIRLDGAIFREELIRSSYFERVYAWLEDRLKEQSEPELSKNEKQSISRILENRRLMKKNLKHSARQILRYLPKLRRTLRGISSNQSKNFLVEHALFYMAISHYPPEKFRNFVYSLESTKKRLKTTNQLGINKEFWDNYKESVVVTVKGSEVPLSVVTWRRQLPHDILVSDICGDCTSTNSHFALSEFAPPRLVDSGYSILKIYGPLKKQQHIGNIYCIAYTVEGRPYLVVQGIEVTAEFVHTSEDVARALIQFAENYADKCGFSGLLLYHEPSIREWIQSFVKANYKKETMNLCKIGGTAHLAEVGLDGEYLLGDVEGVYTKKEQRMELFIIN